MGVCCCLLITILWELPTVIGSLGVFSLVSELSGTVTDMMARLSDTHSVFLVLPSVKKTKRWVCWSSCFGFPVSPTAYCGCFIPNPFPCGFHNEKSIEAFAVFFTWRIPRAHVSVLWTIVSTSPTKFNGRLQDQALSDCLVFLAPCLDLEAIKCSCHKGAANKCRCFHFNKKFYKEPVTIPWLYGMIKLTRICMFRACKKMSCLRIAVKILLFCFVLQCPLCLSGK